MNLAQANLNIINDVIPLRLTGIAYIGDLCSGNYMLF